MDEDEKRAELIHELLQQVKATPNNNEKLKLRAWAILLEDMREIKQAMQRSKISPNGE